MSWTCNKEPEEIKPEDRKRKLDEEKEEEKLTKEGTKYYF